MAVCIHADSSRKKPIQSYEEATALSLMQTTSQNTIALRNDKTTTLRECKFHLSLTADGKELKNFPFFPPECNRLKRYHCAGCQSVGLRSIPPQIRRTPSILLKGLERRRKSSTDTANDISKKLLSAVKNKLKDQCSSYQLPAPTYVTERKKKVSRWPSTLHCYQAYPGSVYEVIFCNNSKDYVYCELYVDGIMANRHMHLVPPKSSRRYNAWVSAEAIREILPCEEWKETQVDGIAHNSEGEMSAVKSKISSLEFSKADFRKSMFLGGPAIAAAHRLTRSIRGGGPAAVDGKRVEVLKGKSFPSEASEAKESPNTEIYREYRQFVFATPKINGPTNRMTVSKRNHLECGAIVAKVFGVIQVPLLPLNEFISEVPVPTSYLLKSVNYDFTKSICERETEKCAARAANADVSTSEDEEAPEYSLKNSRTQALHKNPTNEVEIKKGGKMTTVKETAGVSGDASKKSRIPHNVEAEHAIPTKEKPSSVIQKDDEKLPSSDGLEESCNTKLVYNGHQRNTITGQNGHSAKSQAKNVTKLAQREKESSHEQHLNDGNKQLVESVTKQYRENAQAEASKVSAEESFQQANDVMWNPPKQEATKKVAQNEFRKPKEAAEKFPKYAHASSIIRSLANTFSYKIGGRSSSEDMKKSTLDYVPDTEAARSAEEIDHASQPTLLSCYRSFFNPLTYQYHQKKSLKIDELSKTAKQEYAEKTKKEEVRAYASRRVIYRQYTPANIADVTVVHTSNRMFIPCYTAFGEAYHDIERLTTAYPSSAELQIIKRIEREIQMSAGPRTKRAIPFTNDSLTAGEGQENNLQGCNKNNLLYSPEKMQASIAARDGCIQAEKIALEKMNRAFLRTPAEIKAGCIATAQDSQKIIRLEDKKNEFAYRESNPQASHHNLHLQVPLKYDLSKRYTYCLTSKASEYGDICQISDFHESRVAYRKDTRAEPLDILKIIYADAPRLLGMMDQGTIRVSGIYNYIGRVRSLDILGAYETDPKAVLENQELKACYCQHISSSLQLNEEGNNTSRRKNSRSPKCARQAGGNMVTKKQKRNKKQGGEKGSKTIVEHRKGGGEQPPQGKGEAKPRNRPSALQSRATKEVKTNEDNCAGGRRPETGQTGNRNITQGQQTELKAKDEDDTKQREKQACEQLIPETVANVDNSKKQATKPSLNAGNNLNRKKNKKKNHQRKMTK